MKIDLICNDGSPLGVSEHTIYGDGVQLGVGGAELAMLTMCKAWKEAGHDVTLYNNPREGGASCFPQRTLDEFNPQEQRDFLIIFRSPNARADGALGKKVWWSCDQFTVGDFREFAAKVDKIVTISDFHSNYFSINYGINNSIPIDLPVRDWEYDEQEVVRNPKQLIFCSIPDRGVMQLAEVWRRIVAQIPDAELHITSDWRLWNPEISPSYVAPYRLAMSELPNVVYHALVDRKELVRLQKQSSIHLYPCIYDELFCIAVAETQVAGCYPVTSAQGAVSTTNMGFKTPYHASSTEGQMEMADVAVKLLQNPEGLALANLEIEMMARKRFSVKEIVNKWQTKIFAE